LTEFVSVHSLALCVVSAVDPHLMFGSHLWKSRLSAKQCRRDNSSP